MGRRGPLCPSVFPEVPVGGFREEGWEFLFLGQALFYAAVNLVLGCSRRLAFFLFFFSQHTCSQSRFCDLPGESFTHIVSLSLVIVAAASQTPLPVPALDMPGIRVLPCFSDLRPRTWPSLLQELLRQPHLKARSSPSW